MSIVGNESRKGSRRSARQDNIVPQAAPNSQHQMERDRGRR